MPRQGLILVLLALVIPVLAASCGQTGKPGPEAKPPEAHEIRKEYRQGPFAVRLVVNKDVVSIAETVVLAIEAESEADYEAEPPKFGDQLSQFGIRDYREDPPQISSQGKITTRRVYTLEPFLSGDYTISPLRVGFRKKAQGAAANQEGLAGADSVEHAITTEEITIKVNSLLDKDRKEAVLNPIKGPVDLPAKPISPWTILLALGTAVLLGGGGLLLLRRSKRAKRLPTAADLPAHDLAYRQLREIFEEKLLERGEFKLFFARISDVVRVYIEDRFGLHAPKRTTEEFLADIGREAPFSQEHRGLLMEFLQNCDLVKFAEHQPSFEEIDKTIASCKAFIEATKTQPVEPPPPKE